MADWHILTRGPAGYRAIFHIPIPATTNPVGVSYRTALVRSGIGGSTVLPDGDGTGGTISAAEKTAIASGALLEHEMLVDVPDTAERVAFMTDLFNETRRELLERLQAQLAQYGRVSA